MALAQLQLEADDLIYVEPGYARDLTERKRGLPQQGRGMAAGVHAARLGPPPDGITGHRAAQFVAIQASGLGRPQGLFTARFVVVNEGVHQVGRAGKAIERFRTKADVIGHMGVATLEVRRRFVAGATGGCFVQGQPEAFSQTGRRRQRIGALTLKRALRSELQQIVEALPLRL